MAKNEIKYLTAIKQEKPKKKPLISDAEATEYLLKKLRKYT